MLFTFASIFFFKYTKRAHPVFFLSQWTYFRFLSSLHMGQDLRLVLGWLKKDNIHLQPDLQWSSMKSLLIWNYKANDTLLTAHNIVS